MPNGSNWGVSGLLAHDFRAHFQIFGDRDNRCTVVVDFHDKLSFFYSQNNFYICIINYKLPKHTKKSSFDDFFVSDF